MARQFDQNKIKEGRRNYQAMIRESQIHCDHKDAKGPVLESISDTKEFIRDRNQYGDCAVICRNCKDVFDMTSFNQKDIRDALQVFYSMCNQAKVLFNPSDDDYEKIENIMSILDEMQATFVQYYLKNIAQLTNGQKKQKEQSRQKGKLGISAGQFAQK